MSCRICLVALLVVAAVAACDSGGGKVVETRDGRVTVTGDGARTKVTIDGDAGSRLVIGTGTVPQGFPADVPLPRGATLRSAAHSTRGGQDYFRLDYTVHGAADRAVATYRKDLERGGLTVAVGPSDTVVSARGNGEQVLAVAVPGRPPTLSVTVSPA